MRYSPTPTKLNIVNKSPQKYTSTAACTLEVAPPADPHQAVLFHSSEVNTELCHVRCRSSTGKNNLYLNLCHKFRTLGADDCSDITRKI